MVGHILRAEGVEVLEAFGPDFLEYFGEALVAQQLGRGLRSGAHGEDLVGLDEVLASDDVVHAEDFNEKVDFFLTKTWATRFFRPTLAIDFLTKTWIFRLQKLSFMCLMDFPDNVFEFFFPINGFFSHKMDVSINMDFSNKE